MADRQRIGRGPWGALAVVVSQWFNSQIVHPLITFARLRSPFPRWERPAPLIVHACHHKVGTVWFSNVLKAVARSYGLRFFAGEQIALPGDADLFLQEQGRVNREIIPHFRGSHMVRDPRDVIVSGYFYHLKTTETWARMPNLQLAGRSYQEYLNSMDKDAGLLAEIEFQAPRNIHRMTSWIYGDARFCELRYEAVLADEETSFQRVFRHYGFSESAIDRCVGIALGFSLSKIKERTSHIRSGTPGEWRKHFTNEHKEAFKRSTNDAAVQLGYETNSDW